MLLLGFGSEKKESTRIGEWLCKRTIINQRVVCISVLQGLINTDYGNKLIQI